MDNMKNLKLVGAIIVIVLVLIVMYTMQVDTMSVHLSGKERERLLHAQRTGPLTILDKKYIVDPDNKCACSK